MNLQPSTYDISKSNLLKDQTPRREKLDKQEQENLHAEECESSAIAMRVMKSPP